MNRPELHVLGDTFFATLRDFCLQCPTCGKVWGWGRKYKLTAVYNPRTQAFRCTECGFKARLGIVAWPSSKAMAHGRPIDTMPSPRQSLRIRGAAAGGLWVEGHRVKGREHVNALAGGPPEELEVGERGTEGEGIPPSSTLRRRAWRNVEGEQGQRLPPDELRGEVARVAAGKSIERNLRVRDRR